jgi:hypothetical protein
MTVATYTEPLTPLRDWLRGLDLAAKVYVIGQGGLPAEAFRGGDDAADLVGTVLALTRAGGGTDFPYDRPLIQFDCWAPRAGAATVAGDLAAALCTELEQPGLYGPVPLADLWLISAAVNSNIPVSSTHPRHVVTADVTVQAR